MDAFPPGLTDRAASQTLRKLFASLAGSASRYSRTVATRPPTKSGGGGAEGPLVPAGGTGGSGGGGDGKKTGSATAGSANTGGGGGGGPGQSIKCGAAGGKGIVIIRYKFQ